MKTYSRRANHKLMNYIHILFFLIILVFRTTVSQGRGDAQLENDFLDQITIPATGGIAESNLVLENNVRYVIVITGIYRYDVGEPGEFADAQYQEDDNDQWTIRNNLVEFDGIRLTANTFDLEHHTYHFFVTGQGHQIAFRIYDVPGSYSDNDGILTATIYPYLIGVDRDPYANIVLSYQVGGANNTHTNAAAVLGLPNCGAFDLSLGGGWVIVDMGKYEEIKDDVGNDLRVYETDPTCGDGQAEAYAVYVGDSPDGPWYEIGTGNGITEFDVIGSGLSLVRYVRIEDRTPDSSGSTPGADIDAIEAINLIHPPLTQLFYLPMTMNTYIHHYPGPWESEENDTWYQANGYLYLSQDYYGYPDDQRDWFSIYLTQPVRIEVNLSNHTGQDVQMHVYYQAVDANYRVCYVGAAPFVCDVNGQAGRYYIFIYTNSGFNTTTPYTLRVTALAKGTSPQRVCPFQTTE